MIREEEGKVMETVLKAVEAKVEEELERLADPEESDLLVLRKQRFRELKERQEKEKDWRQAGHGEYSELSGEKEFFSASAVSHRLVAHFYSKTSMRTDIMDKHLKILAPKHLETKFLKIDAEKAPFLAERLFIRTLPTVLISVGGKIVDRIVGFSSLGNRDDFSTETLEWRLAQADGIDYAGDKETSPLDAQPPKQWLLHRPKNLR